MSKRPGDCDEAFDPLDEALDAILGAWRIAADRGVEPDLIANAALFAALTDLVGAYGEPAIVNFTNGLVTRIKAGEFSGRRILQ